MIINSKNQLIDLIKDDEKMMKILQTVAELNLPDWWISAGFIRNKIWDLYHDYERRTPYNDIDVIYYDVDNLDENNEKVYEQQLYRTNPDLPWSVKNQARMHIRNNTEQYKSSVDAVNQYPECPTAICIKLENNEVILHYEYSINELFAGVVKPTPFFEKNLDSHHVYQNRIKEKKWKEQWPYLNIVV